MANISGNKASRWRHFIRLRVPSDMVITALLVANAVTVLAPTAFILYFAYLSKHGASGTEFFSFILLPVVPFTIGTLVLNLVIVPIYLIRSKPKVLYTVLTSLALLTSLTVLVTTAYAYTHPKHDKINTIAKDEQVESQNDQNDYKFIDHQQALQELQSCIVDEFVGYNGNIDLVPSSARRNVQYAEDSTTGIFEFNDGGSQPILIYASKAQTADLLANAQAARGRCQTKKTLTVYIDNTAEVQNSAGNWRFVSVATQ